MTTKKPTKRKLKKIILNMGKDRALKWARNLWDEELVAEKEKSLHNPSKHQISDYGGGDVKIKSTRKGGTKQ